MHDLLITIPIYNEEHHIEDILNSLFCYININSTDVLVIDDGSTDGSFMKLKKFPEIKFIRNTRNYGYGYSIQTSFRYAVNQKYNFLLTMDADGQHLPQTIEKFLENKDSADIISGSRYLTPPDDVEQYIVERFKINRKITSILNEITDYNLTDSFCGMKLYNVDKLKNMKTTDPYYAMPLQVIIRAWEQNLTWKEIPVPLIYINNQRNFNELYKNSRERFNYYITIIKQELERLNYEDHLDFRPPS